MDKWKEHLDTLRKRLEKLNALNFKSLHYTNSLGTDLTVELPEGHVWEAGNDVTLSGQTYIANIPTEELFHLPPENRSQWRGVRLHAPGERRGHH